MRLVYEEHKPFVVVVALAVLASLVGEWTAAQSGITLGAATYWPTYWLFLLPALVPVPLMLAAELWRGRKAAPARPLTAAWVRVRSGALSNRRIAGALLATIGIALVINIFSSWKLTIPRLHPFTWDPALHRLDVALHGGRMPWALLQPVLGHAPVTRFLDGVYLLWHPVVGLATAALVWSDDRALRNRFLVAFVACWVVLGAVMAMLFSSAGPCYWAAVVGGPDPYAPLLEYLRSVDAHSPIAALRIQGGLWARYTGMAEGAYSGISAMPSLHVAIPVLFAAVAVSSRRRWLAVAAVGFALLTLLGSVHLGWHYAVDGYVGGLGALVIWWTVADGRSRISHARYSDARERGS